MTTVLSYMPKWAFKVIMRPLARYTRWTVQRRGHARSWDSRTIGRVLTYLGCDVMQVKVSERRW